MFNAAMICNELGPAGVLLISPYSTFGPEINIQMSPHEDVTACCGGKLLSSRPRLNLVLNAGQLSSRSPSQPEEEQNDSVIVI